MKNKPPMHTQYDISCEVARRTYKGFYYIDKGMLTVSLPGYGSKSAVPGPVPEAIAQIILGELAREVRLPELRQKMATAIRERDAWKGKHAAHYEASCLLVEAMEKEISALQGKSAD